MAISGTISKVGDSVNFTFSGTVQSYNIPSNGLYKLEGWGGQGGYNGGLGGYFVGYAVLEKGSTLYVAVGGQGNTFNGGGEHTNRWGQAINRKGGGATHIAKVNGQLASIGYASFVTNHNGYGVAGGGGSGEPSDSLSSMSCPGGVGGGSWGGDGASIQSYAGDKPARGQAGSQSEGGFGLYSGSFGQGGSSSNNFNGGAGGGGFYGGGAAEFCERNSMASGGGGSGWIGGLPTVTYKGVTYSSSMSSGVQSGNGKAKITLIDKAFPEMYLGELPVEGAYLGDTTIDELHLGELAL